jgi:phosphoribosylaminoimidazolecarboxamide formyltransferase / IMP cyclohydrolase
MAKFRRALISVSDKTGLIEFLRPLVKDGLSIVSTGGTAKLLKAEGFPVSEVEELTGFPEVMDGRVKTLHPRVYMPILGRLDMKEDQDLLKKEKLEPFDLVIVNLYPFENTLAKNAPLDEMIEVIDIGGPSLLRASAKNFKRVAVVCDPADYPALLESDKLTPERLRNLAAKAFFHVSSYDAMIGAYLNPNPEREYSVGGALVQTLRYGENPHQRGLWYRQKGKTLGWNQAKILQGKELSYNNLLDLEAARNMVLEFSGPAAVAVKHNNPCGVSVDKNLTGAVKKSLAADPVSVFGGIIALNKPVDGESAGMLGEIFLECIVAPSFTQEALEIFKKKKNLRLLEWEGMTAEQKGWKFQQIQGGFLLQEPETISGWNPEWKVLGVSPSAETKADLITAWKVCAHLKSNAIAIAANGTTLGLGMGQVNRVDAVDQAILRMQKFHPKPGTAVLASDAFFPFPDSLEKIAAAGIKWVIQPGGSVKDADVFAAAEKLGVTLVLTGQRHFRH